MRRKLISFFILLSFMVTMVSPVMAQSESPKFNQEQALKLAKEVLSVPDSLKNVQISYREESYNEPRKIWEFVWDDSKFGQWHNYRAEINADTGEIISFSEDQDWNQYTKSNKTKSEQECRVIAENLIKKLSAEKWQQVKEVTLPDRKYQEVYSYGPKRYQFTYQRVVDGIFFPENTINISINGENGKVMNYWCNWDNSISFPKVQPSVTVEDAEKIFREKIGMNLMYFQQYGYSPANIARKTPVPLYYSVWDDYGQTGVIDALTGKVIDMYGKEVTVKEKVYLPVKPEPGANNDSGTILSLEEAKAKIKEYVNIPDNLKLMSSRYSEGWGAGSQKVWQFDYNLSDYRGGSSLNVAVDAVTGELINYSRWEQAWDTNKEREVKLDYDACKKIAQEFLKKAAPNRADYVFLYEPLIKSVWFTDGKAIEPPVYSFSFRRIVNGVAFPANSFNIDVDNVTGEIRSFWSNWDSGAKFTDTKDIISEQEAFDKLLAVEKPSLVYTYKVSENGAPSRELMLVYRFFKDVPRIVNASTGKVSTTMEIENPIILEDVSGHWAERELRSLASWGIITGSNNKFNPDKPVTRAEFVNMLAVAKGLEPVEAKTPTFTDVPKEAWYYGSVEAAAKAGLIKGSGGEFNPDKTISRQEIVVMLINSLNDSGQQDSSLDLDKKFKDANTVSSWARKAVTKSVELGILAGKNGSLKPMDPATRAEAAVMLMKLISGENGGKFPYSYAKGYIG